MKDLSEGTLTPSATSVNVVHLSKVFYPYYLVLVATQEDTQEMKILFETTNAEAVMVQVVLIAVCQYVVTIIPVPYRELWLALLLIQLTSLIVFFIEHRYRLDRFTLTPGYTILSTVKPLKK